MSTLKVPFLDLKAHHDPLRAEIMEVVNHVIDDNAFAGGPAVAEFEKNFASYCGVSHCVGVANGTDSLTFILKALGIGPGDEVITVPMTFAATVGAIIHAGATPVFVDIDPNTFTLDPRQLESAITSRTKAIIPVHLFGQCADMDEIAAVVGLRDIKIIEDAAQAHGAKYYDRWAGSLYTAASFSFYPGKNLGAWGEAGAVTTDDPVIYQKVRMLREHGQEVKHRHEMIGYNGRMDGIQAAVLNVKLKYLDEANARRRAAAYRYDELLSNRPELRTPKTADYALHVHHVYAVQVTNRDKIAKRLQEVGIGTSIHYPIPVHLQPAYRGLGYRFGDFPVSEVCGNTFLSLPMYPELTNEQINYVATELRKAVAEFSTPI